MTSSQQKQKQIWGQLHEATDGFPKGGAVFSSSSSPHEVLWFWSEMSPKVLVLMFASQPSAILEGIKAVRDVAWWEVGRSLELACPCWRHWNSSPFFSLGVPWPGGKKLCSTHAPCRHVLFHHRPQKQPSQQTTEVTRPLKLCSKINLPSLEGGYCRYFATESWLTIEK